MLEIGMKNVVETTVTEKNTAKTFCSGALDVFATPAMISLMEECCFKMVQAELTNGEGTVGTKINVSHDKASAIGHKITCEATLTEIDRRRLVFNVKCMDGDDVIGQGTHERFIINNEKFLSKL